MLSSCEYLLVLINAYSRFSLVVIVRSTAVSSVIHKLDKLFSTHGLPLKVKPDNGPPFNRNDFAKYVLTLGINFRSWTTEWSQGNVEVERFM